MTTAEFLRCGMAIIRERQQGRTLAGKIQSRYIHSGFVAREMPLSAYKDAGQPHGDRRQYLGKMLRAHSGRRTHEQKHHHKKQYRQNRQQVTNHDPSGSRFSDFFHR